MAVLHVFEHYCDLYYMRRLSYCPCGRGSWSITFYKLWNDNLSSGFRHFNKKVFIKIHRQNFFPLKLKSLLVIGSSLHLSNCCYMHCNYGRQDGVIQKQHTASLHDQNNSLDKIPSKWIRHRNEIAGWESRLQIFNWYDNLKNTSPCLDQVVRWKTTEPENCYYANVVQVCMNHLSFQSFNLIILIVHIIS